MPLSKGTWWQQGSGCGSTLLEPEALVGLTTGWAVCKGSTIVSSAPHRLLSRFWCRTVPSRHDWIKENHCRGTCYFPMLALRLPKCISHLEGNDTWIAEEYTWFWEYYVVNLSPTKNRKKRMLIADYSPSFWIPSAAKEKFSWWKLRKDP